MTPVHLAPCTLLCSPHCLGAWPKAKLRSILMSRIIQQECMCIFDIVSSLEGWPSGYDPRPLQGRGRSPEKKPLFRAASFSTAPMAPGTCPALRGPAEALQFPHGRVISERWTKLFGQPTGEKEKEKQILSCLPSAPERKGELGVGGHAWDIEVYSKHPEWRKFKWYEDHEKWTPSVETTFTPEKFMSIEIKCH